MVAISGYLDTEASTRVLAKVTLNENIDETERFRSLMGLKNTSAPMDTELLKDLIDYGLNSDNGEDFLKNAAGMLVGSLAKERASRSPEQVEIINDAILNSIHTHSDKTVAMNAAGNMQDAANSNVVNAIGNVMTSSDDYKARKASAQAIEKLNRTNLTTETFKGLLNKEENSDTKAQLIKASGSAKDFNTNNQFKQELVNLADNREAIKSNRMASLTALDKNGYGTTKDEKAKIRNMMLGEKDNHIATKLKEMYRK
jgi:hypothetical protein